MLPLVLVATVVGFVSANPGPICYPPSCTVDDNCLDPIHGYTTPAKCCGGNCVRTTLPTGLLVNSDCNSRFAVEAHERCFGSCDNQIAVCGDSLKCEAYLMPGCACTLAMECLTSSCMFSNAPDNHTVCRAYNQYQDHGMSCVVDAECKSLSCSNGLCVGRINTQSCTSNQQCTDQLICKNLTCSTSCALGAPGCCFYDYDCAGGQGNPNLGFDNYTTYCDRLTGTCTTLPGAGQPCPAFKCLPGHLCAAACNGPPDDKCSGAQICQPFYSIPVGGVCPQSATSLCVKPSVICVRVPPSNNSFCVAYPWAQPGAPCWSTELECMAPANTCAAVGPDPSQRTCVVNGSLPIWSKCWTQGGRACPQQAPCSANVTDRYPSVADLYCNGKLPPGANCTLSSTGCMDGYACWDANDPLSLCYIPLDPTQNCTCNPLPVVGEPCGYYQPCAGGLPCISALGRTICSALVADGEDCQLSSQCQGLDSICNPTTRKCTPILGSSCATMSDCNNGKVSAFQWDCSCSRKCYVSGSPSPAPTSAPTTVPCQVQLDAWNAVKPYLFPQVTSFSSSASWVNLAPTWMSLPNSTLAKLLEYFCCMACGSGTKPYETQTVQGDCGQKTLYRITTDNCNKRRNRLALLNCWTTNSGTKLGLGLVTIVFLASLL